MIPIRLSLRNFMCYRENVPPLSFEGLHLVCLAGDNGNGKSALIDAMTWALWGEARVKSADELISANQTDMEVDFTFAVEQQIFRIIRKRSRPRTPKSAGTSVLDFQTADGDRFKSIASDNNRQTQQKIIDTLHMDYQTFINSAYLRQGHADEFTMKAPAERKEVLGNILDLSHYEKLAERARELSRLREIDKAQMLTTLNELAAEIAKKPEYEMALEQAQQVLGRIEKIAAEKKAATDQIRSQRETLEKKQTELEQVTSRVQHTMGNLRTWEEQIKQHQEKIAEYEKLFTQRGALEEGYALFTEAKRRCDELDQKLRKLFNLERQKNQLEKVIDQENQKVKAEHLILQRRFDDLNAKTKTLAALKGQKQQLHDRLTGLQKQGELLHDQELAAQKLQTEANYLESHLARLEQEIKEIGGKLDLLSGKTEARCPLCETELGREGLDLIRDKYERDRRGKTELKAATQQELQEEKTALAAAKKEVINLEAQLNQDKSSVQAETRLLESKIAEAEEAGAELTAVKAKITETEQRLMRKDFALPQQEAFLALEETLVKMDYDEEKHKQYQQQVKELEKYDLLYHKLEEAVQSMPRESAAASRAAGQIEQLKQSLTADQEKLPQLQQELAGLPALRDRLAEMDAENKELERQRQQAQEVLWQFKVKLEHCAEQEARKKEKEKLFSQSASEESIYRELAEAFGKRGIQVLLIDTALPAIEEEANRLLSRMTDNRMHVKFETLRPTKKGETTETLDINITDELGTRNYEMFSGGEAFRINFAIRIALSRLLARRAGARLPTLIIDEGFGTQDSGGIEKLKEAIISIRNDFEKIIVITHIEELRNSFPSRIDVVKTAEGSTFSVN